MNAPTTVTGDAGASQPAMQSIPRRNFLRIGMLAAGGLVLSYSLPDAVAKVKADGMDTSSDLSPNTLPAAQIDPRLTPLLTMHLDVRPMQVIDAKPGAGRLVGVVPSGEFRGERLSGTILEGGNDWLSVRSDGSMTLDVRQVLKTDDGALIEMSYRGMRHAPADVVARLERGETVDPASYYFRIIPMFETAAPQYDWLNRIVAVGSGHLRADGVVFNLFEVL